MYSAHYKLLKQLASEAEKSSDGRGVDGLFFCLEKEMSFLAIKVIFKSVINYGCNLVQIQQISLTEEKQ